MPSAETSSLPPQQLQFPRNDIEIGKRIGIGAFGVVSEGKILSLNLPVAVKELVGEDAVKQCRNEVALLSRLRHAHLVRVEGYCEVSPTEAYLLLELSTEGALTTKRVEELKQHACDASYMQLILRWVRQLADGLAYLHANNVLHLDLKPSNVLLFKDASGGKCVKLCDFGFSKMVQASRATAISKLTLAYAAPEVIREEDATVSTDLYGVGCVLCELLTGAPPWGTATSMRIMGAVLAGRGPTIADDLWPPDCPHPIRCAVENLLGYDAVSRGTLREVHATLDVFVQPSSTSQDAISSTSSCSLAPGCLGTIALDPLIKLDLRNLIGCEVPKDRVDLEFWAKQLTKRSLNELLKYVKKLLRGSTVVAGAADGDAHMEDALAIGLYTTESGVYRLINGHLSHPRRTLQALSHVAPMARRIYEAVLRRGTPYRGEAYRVLKACTNEGSPLMQSAFNNFKTHFAVGSAVNFYQFASFTTDMERIDAITKGYHNPLIVLRCKNIVAFDISKYSTVKLEDPSNTEAEVLCLPPSYFVVSGTPMKLGTTVVVDIEYAEAKSNADAFVGWALIA